MGMKKRIRIILPAFNEEEAIPVLLEKIKGLASTTPFSIEAMVVNDGSTDQTLEKARFFGESLPLFILDLQPNRGFAEAIKEGLKAALQDTLDSDILITMDADGSQDPLLIPDLVEKIEQGADVVIASRFRKGAQVHGVSPLRKITSLRARILFRLVVPLKGVKDYTCGYRAFRARLLKRAQTYFRDTFIQEQGFAATPEILLKLQKFSPTFAEVPLILRYDLKTGSSKMDVPRTIVQSFVLLAKYWFSQDFSSPPHE